MFSCCSLLLVGNDALVGELRLLTAIELFLHSYFYFCHPVLVSVCNKNKEWFSSPDKILSFCVSFNSIDSCDRGRDLIKLCICKDAQWSSYCCILALSSVVDRSVHCVYPDFGPEKFRILFNQTIKPCRVNSSLEIEPRID